MVAAIVAVGFGLLYLVNVLLMMGGMVIMAFFLAFTYGILIYCFVGNFLTQAEEKY